MKRKNKFIFTILITAILAVIISLSFYTCETTEKNDSIPETGGNMEPNDFNRIYIKDNQFMVNGKRIWINGVNTPWDRWNDFGTNNFRESWWDAEFAKLHAHGVNATRIWINCNSQGAISLNQDGTFNSVSASHWTHLDKLFELAAKHKIYIMATLLSFDHFKAPSNGPDYSARWRAMIQSDSASQSFAENYTIPFVNRYKNNPWLWSIDIINEPDWIHEDAACTNISWEYISYFLAINAAAIREASGGSVLVTVGIAYPKWNIGAKTGNVNATEDNKVSDEFFAARYASRGQTPNQNARLDFWSTHYYDWVGEWYQIPFYRPPAAWGLPDTKPSVIGECSARGIGNNWANKFAINAGIVTGSIINDYEAAFNNGWQGVMAWTSNGVDDNGGIPGNGTPSNRVTQLGDATLNMLNKHREHIFVWE